MCYSSRRRHARYWRDWSSDVCSSDLLRRDTPGQVQEQYLLLRAEAIVVAGLEDDRPARPLADAVSLVADAWLASGAHSTRPRSEERRGGKECRSRWSPDH